jgi:tRNA dimethylallyltransferase
LIDHFENGTPLEEAKTNAVARTRRFARRQLRWFGRDPRITWIPTDGVSTEIALASMTELLGD